MPAAIALTALIVAAVPACTGSVDVTLTEIDVTVISETEGVGKKARNGDIVCIDYRVLTPEGEELIWGENFCFELGAGVVIEGLDDTVPGMQRGGSRVVKVPSHKHWGRNGYGGKIPARTPLIIEVKLSEVK